jgi:hypothetical protein
MSNLIYCANIQGVDWIFNVDYEVLSYGEKATYEHDGSSFKFVIKGATGALDTGDDAVLLPVATWILDHLEDDEQLAEEIEWAAHDWKLANEQDGEAFRDALRADAA